MLSRRQWLSGSFAVLVPAVAAFAQQRRGPGDPLRLGVERALADSGLATALLRGFGADTGIVVKPVPGPALALLDAVERGELDALLSNAPAHELRLEQQGLAHDRRPLASGEFVIVGPAPRARQKDPAAIAGLRDGAAALIQLHSAAQAMPGAVTFLSAGDGSGAHLLEQAMWREAKLAPAAPWYLSAEPDTDLIRQVRARGAYALVERGAWAALGGRPLAVLVEGDPRMVEQVHVLRAFRGSHPAGKIFIAWVAGEHGRRIVAAQHAYRAA